jgi:hypothetical protein
VGIHGKDNEVDYNDEHLNEIKNYLNLNKLACASRLLEQVIRSKAFADLAIEQIKDPDILTNFINWLPFINMEFVKGSYKEKWQEGDQSRGNNYTMYADFYEQYVGGEMDILAFMFHEYLHHVQDRVLWKETGKLGKDRFSIKEKSFIEDMYSNAWIRSVAPNLGVHWEQFLFSHDEFHELKFDEEEAGYNSLLTGNCTSDDEVLIDIYDRLEGTKKFFSPEIYKKYITTWFIAKLNTHITEAINDLQINKEEWSYGDREKNVQQNST